MQTLIKSITAFGNVAQDNADGPALGLGLLICGVATTATLLLRPRE